MHPRNLRRFPIAALPFVVLLLLIPGGAGSQTVRNGREGVSSEQRTEKYFESILSQPQQLLAFLLRMPKGADLHNHLSGAIYAESFIQWAAETGLCVNTTTMTLATCGQNGAEVRASDAMSNSVHMSQAS